MPKFYNSDLPPSANPSEEESLPATPQTGNGELEERELYEEYDISSFDFTIADPWETEENALEESDADLTEFAKDSEEFSPEPSLKPEDSFEPEPISESESVSDSEPFSEPEERISSPAPEREPVAEPEIRTGSEPEIDFDPTPRRTGKEPSQSRVSRIKNRGKEFFGRLREKGTEIKLPEDPLTIPTETKEFLRTKVKRYLRYALRPSALYENLPETFWSLFLGGTSLFMGVFYLLVGMDWHRASLISAGRLWAFVAVGLLVGATAALAFAGGTQILSLIIRKEPLRPFRVLSSVAGATIFPAAILLTGLLLGLFGAATSMSFGIIALLWWIFVLMEVLRDLFGPRYVPIVTFLSVWAFVLFVVISATFSLK